MRITEDMYKFYYLIWEKLITLTVLASALLNWLSFPILHWKAKLQTPLIPQIAAHVVLEVLVPMIIIWLTDGNILYKTKFQLTIALSSTEAEFTAACDAGKSILYVCSILNEIGVHQDEAITLFIDNNGALLMATRNNPHVARDIWISRLLPSVTGLHVNYSS